MPIFKYLFACSVFCISMNIAAQSLTVLSWGGAYEHSQAQAYFEPYSKKTGVTINTASYNGGTDELRQQVLSGTPAWDLIDLVVADNIEACQQGWLERIDHQLLPDSPSGMPAEADFLPGTLTPCGVGQIVSATVLAYNDDKFQGRKPTRVNDLFDLHTFPGKRGLQKKPIAILEWALLSYGVPIKDLYTLLSTPRGLRMAFAKLDTIKEHIVWWEKGDEPARLLADGTVSMSSGYNGRFFNAAVNDNLPIEVIWSGQLLNYSTWGIPTGAKNAAAAHEFIRFATDTQRLADQAKYIAYGPARRSSANLVRKHLSSGIDIRPHLPTYPPHREFAILKDQLWYARTQSQITDMFNQWLQQP